MALHPGSVAGGALEPRARVGCGDRAGRLRAARGVLLGGAQSGRHHALLSSQPAALSGRRRLRRRPLRGPVRQRAGQPADRGGRAGHHRLPERRSGLVPLRLHGSGLRHEHDPGARVASSRSLTATAATASSTRPSSATRTTSAAGPARRSRAGSAAGRSPARRAARGTRAGAPHRPYARDLTCGCPFASHAGSTDSP